MTSHGVLWRTCKAILKPVYRNLTCRGDVTCDVTRPSRVASSCWPIYNHKVTILTSIPIFIQLAALTSYFQHICISKVTAIIVHFLSIHSYVNTLNTFHTRYQFPLAILRKTSGVDINHISTRIKYRYLTHINRNITKTNLNEPKQHRQAQTWLCVSVSPDWSRDHNNRTYTRILTYMK